MVVGGLLGTPGEPQGGPVQMRADLLACSLASHGVGRHTGQVWDASCQVAEFPSCLPGIPLMSQKQWPGLGELYCTGIWATELAIPPTGQRKQEAEVDMNLGSSTTKQKSWKSHLF